jgi:AcrR family transcriptional regulator
MNKRQLQKEQTRKKIFEAALQTYAQKGFLNTRIDDLTKSAGISHGNFFVHYAKHEDLIIKAIEEIGKSIYERFLELASEKMNLENILGVHLDVIQENETIYYYLVTEGPFLPEQARSAIFILQNGISHWMKKAVDTEKIDLQFYYFFNLWLGNLHYYLQNRDMFSPDKSVIEKYRDDFIKMFKLFEGSEKYE